MASGLSVAVVVGDERYLELARALAQRGVRVRAAGWPSDRALPGVQPVPTLPQAVDGAQVLVLPVGGVDARGHITRCLDGTTELRLDAEALRGLKAGGRIVAGDAPPYLRRLAESLGLQLVDLQEEEPFRLLNAVVTAEGAVQLAMNHLPITLHGSQAVVVGLGRCGQQLARVLQALGARVTAVAYGPVEAARAYALGIQAVGPEQVGEAVRQADVVFNTAPAPVLTRCVLAGMRPEVFIVDIASEPGGTDFEAARQLGIAFVHARALPARTAPRTAGRLMAQVVWGLLGGPDPGAWPQEAAGPVPCRMA